MKFYIKPIMTKWRNDISIQSMEWNIRIHAVVQYTARCGNIQQDALASVLPSPFSISSVSDMLESSGERTEFGRSEQVSVTGIRKNCDKFHAKDNVRTAS